MGRLFGTDGVRGVAGSELTCKLAYDLGRAGAYVLATNAHRPRILIGRDTRISGDMLEAALVAGICSVGAEAICAGVIPTPGIAYLTRKHGCDAGVVISASHNPFAFNGIKFFDGRGYKLPDALEERIEAIILDGAEQPPLQTGSGIGRRLEMRDAARQYIDFVQSTTDVLLGGMHIVVDCANGATSAIAPVVLREMGAVVTKLSDDPSGVNINDNCGSTHLEQLRARVLADRADIGLAFDGDADRLLVVDEKGQSVDGDQIMLICGHEMMQRGKLAKDTIVATVMTNLGMDIACKELGIHLVKTQVGDRYVLERMLAEGYSLGGEQSGHLIFLEHNSTGDGMISALQLLRVMVKTQKSASALAAMMHPLPQTLVNAHIPEARKNDYLQDKIITAYIAELETKYGERGRVLIRPSGTEPLVRVMIEGEDQRELDRDAKALAQLMEARIGE
nr:phosphoglucosamine mutase [Maliibacterium massiliense]